MFLESESELKKLQEKLELESLQNMKRRESQYCDPITKKKDALQVISCSISSIKETSCRLSTQISDTFQSSTVKHNTNQEVHQISCSTPINNKTLHNSDIQLSSILNKQCDASDNNQAIEIIEKNITNNNIIESNTSESSVPSGTTDILNAIGDDWMTHSVENEREYDNNDLQFNNNNNNYDDQENNNKHNHSNESGKDLDYSLNKNNINNMSVLNAIGNDWTTSSVENYYNDNDLDDYGNQKNNNECNYSNELAKGSDYFLNSDEIAKDQDSLNQNSTNQNSTTDTHGTSESHSKEDSSMEISCLQNVSPLDIRKVQVLSSKDSSSKRTVKKYFCPYCKKLQTKFARHLELKHKIEADVQKFIHIKRGTQERAKIIAAIRNHGSLLHNTHHELNTGVFLTVRQRQAKYKKTADDYICCTNCKGFYSKLTIRLHFNKCKTTHKKCVREITVMGKRLTGYIHTSAN